MILGKFQDLSRASSIISITIERSNSFFLSSSHFESGRERILKMKILRKPPYTTFAREIVGFLGLVYVQGVWWGGGLGLR